MEMKLNWKIYSIVIGFLALGVFILFLEKILFFFITVLVTMLLALLLGFFQPLKYIGIELVTLSTIFVGVVYGPVVGGIYGFTSLIAHLVIGRYYIGSYLMWLIPEYVGIGILSGILKTELIGPVGLALIAGMNIVNLALTFIVENERGVKHLPYVIGNIAVNSIILLNFFEILVNFVG